MSLDKLKNLGQIENADEAKESQKKASKSNITPEKKISKKTTQSKKATEKKTTSFSLDKSDLKLLDIHSSVIETSVSNIISDLIKSYIKKNKLQEEYSSLIKKNTSN